MNGEYIDKWDKAIEELMLVQQESLLKPANGGDKKIRPYEEKPVSPMKSHKCPKKTRGRAAAAVAKELVDDNNS